MSDRWAARIAVVCAVSMIAHQVGAKATRDAFFLIHFGIEALPAMLIASALVSVVAVLLTSWAMRRVGPGHLVPATFAASSLLSWVEWSLITSIPRTMAVVIYLHIAVLGSILISGFWSLINERFDPHSAKHYISTIAGGATVGGMVGGVLAERVGALFELTMMLPILAVLHAVCGVTVYVLRPPPTPSSRRQARASTSSGVTLLKESGYLRRIALLIFLGTVSAALLDFLFKAHATEAFTNQDSMLRFFAVFYTAVGVLTVIVQAATSQRALERWGLARTAASLPAAVALGGVGLLVAPVLAVATLARGAESILRSSTFRSAYELLYMPLHADEKRASKTLIDVGVDRMGDAVGGAIVQLLLFLPVVTGQAMMALAVACLGVWAAMISMALHKHYVRALERSLVHQAVELDLDAARESTTRAVMMQTLGGDWELDPALLSNVLPSSGERVAAPPQLSVSTRAEPAAVLPASGLLDPLVEKIQIVRSGDADSIRRLLRGAHPLDLALVTHLVPLLAWDALSIDITRVLRTVAAEVQGQLIDALLNVDEDFAVRRRLPRVLCVVPSKRVVEGLLLGMADRRFEVRFHCGRALARLHPLMDSFAFDQDRVFGLVQHEVEVDRRVWASRRLLEQVDDDRDTFVDDVLRDRADRSLEHVFTMLSLVLPRQPLRIAFRGLHTTDKQLRGTALEYLESVLPPALNERLWPFIQPSDDDALRQASELVIERRADILDQLMHSRESIDLNLKELRGRLSRGE